jgi:hypothetical protein
MQPSWVGLLSRRRNREKADRRRAYPASSQRRGGVHKSFMTLVRSILAFSGEVRFMEPEETRLL